MHERWLHAILITKCLSSAKCGSNTMIRFIFVEQPLILYCLQLPTNVYDLNYETDIIRGGMFMGAPKARGMKYSHVGQP